MGGQVQEKVNMITDQPKWLTTLTVLFLLLFVVLNAAYVFVGSLNEDEGWYLYAAKLVYEGQHLYKDFMYTQAPLMPYVYGLPQKLFGESLYLGRFESLFFALLTALSLVLAARRLKGRLSGMFVAAALALSPMVLHHLTMIKTYSLATLLISLAILTLTLKTGRIAKAATSCALLCLASGVRLSVIATVPVLLLLWLLIDRDGWKPFLAGVIASIIVTSVSFLPSVLPSFTNAWFNMIGFHTVTYESTSLFSDIYDKVDNFGSLSNNISLIMVGSALALILFVVYRRKPWLEAMSEQRVYLQIGAILAALVAANTLPKAMRWDYFIVCVPCLVVLSGCAVTKLWETAYGRRSRSVILATVGSFLLLNAIGGNHNLDIRGLHLPISEAEQVARFIDQHVAVQDSIFTMHSFIAIQARRNLLPGLEMGVFSYYPEWDTETANRYGVINDDIAREYVSDERAAAVLFTPEDFRRNSTLKTLDPDERRKNAEQMLQLIKSRYYLATTVPAFGQWKETLWVYLPRAPQSETTELVSSR
jgi:hypothetical protein